MQDVEIYPASWYYNACVQGFLEVLAWGLGNEGEEIITEQILRSDGRAVIPGDLMTAAFSPRCIPYEGPPLKEVPEKLPILKRIGWWWIEKSFKEGFISNSNKNRKDNNPTDEEKINMVFGRLFHFKKGYYPNLANLAHLKSVKSKVEFLNLWFDVERIDTLKKATCSFCGQKIELNKIDNIYSTFFLLPMSIHLGNSYEEFPNLFWDGTPNLIMCKQCRSYFLCFHLVSKNGFFINTDSLLVNWYLNHLLAGKIDSDYHQSILNALQYNRQLRNAISSWGLQNTEILLFGPKDVRYYPISARLVRLLLIPQVATLIGRIHKDTKLPSAVNIVWEIILQERFDYLPIVIFKSLRAQLTGKNKEKDPEVIFSSQKNDWPVNNLIQLYFTIKQQIANNKGGAIMGNINLREIRQEARRAPLDLNTNTGKNLAYRLMELTRLNKKTEVYHLLLRLYLSSGTKQQFPVPLARLFETNDSESFKAGIYAFIAGLSCSDTQEDS
ncbi:Cas8a1 family CRISPR/Cas system-associated protein [Moorella naiadis]|uniref:Cas8a1 family CRISPR/Cas system-associated protein n=1 Tax=Moorella naiadis (nom. illeg.) TaxID=3093670 RepID=UPI003D9C96AE